MNTETENGNAKPLPNPDFTAMVESNDEPNDAFPSAEASHYDFPRTEVQAVREGTPRARARAENATKKAAEAAEAAEAAIRDVKMQESKILQLREASAGVHAALKASEERFSVAQAQAAEAETLLKSVKKAFSESEEGSASALTNALALEAEKRKAVEDAAAQCDTAADQWARECQAMDIEKAKLDEMRATADGLERDAAALKKEAEDDLNAYKILLADLEGACSENERRAAAAPTTCAGCLFWRREINETSQFGECRRSAIGPASSGAFPRTLPYDYCFEGAPADEAGNNEYVG